MSTGQDNFDDLFRSKLSDNEFEFNEANWDKAEALIIQTEKKRKRRLIGFIFFIGLGLGICLMIPFMGGNEKENVSLVDKKVSAEAVSKNEEKNTTQANTETDKKLATQKENSTEGAQINTPANNVASTQAKENAEKEEQVISYTSSNKTNTSNKIPTSARNNKVYETGKQKDNTVVENIANNATSKGKEEAKNRSNNEIQKDNTKPAQDVVKQEENPVIAQTTDTTHALPITATSTGKDTSAVVVNTKADSTKATANEISPDDKKEIFKPITVFSIDAGANYSFGWAYNTTKEANGFNAILGVGVMHYFTKKWSASVGVQYNSLAHLSYSSYSSSNTQFDFGYSETKTVITPKMLYYMAIPVKVYYHINDKNSIAIGANVLYLLNTSSTIDTYTESSLQATSHTSQTKIGYMDGFSTWDIQPTLTYRRRFFKRFSASAEAYYGLMDIKSNSYFGINKSENNKGLKLTLSYNFFSK